MILFFLKKNLKVKCINELKLAMLCHLGSQFLKPGKTGVRHTKRVKCINGPETWHYSPQTLKIRKTGARTCQPIENRLKSYLLKPNIDVASKTGFIKT